MLSFSPPIQPAEAAQPMLRAVAQTFLGAPPEAPESSRWPLEQAEALLQHLAKTRWYRLRPEEDDPLDVLFANRARQWTAGWDTASGNLYLLIWETLSWEERPSYLLYENGRLIFQETEGASRHRTALLQKLMESEHLPFTTPEGLLEPLRHFQASAARRQAATQALLASLISRPEIFEPLKPALFEALEADLDMTQWPLLEMLKLHCLAHKNGLTDLFRNLIVTGLIRTQADNRRLDAALTRLQSTYLLYGRQVPPLFQEPFRTAHAEFRRILMDGPWRIKLRFNGTP